MESKYRVAPWGHFEDGHCEWEVQEQTEPNAPYRLCLGVTRGLTRAFIYSSLSRAQEVAQLLSEGKEFDFTIGLAPLGSSK